MPAYVLDGSGQVSLPRRALAVTAEAAGVAVHLRASQDGVADQSAVHPSPGFMILPRLSARTDIAAVPGGGAVAFPPGTILRVVIGTDSHTEIDPDRAELTPVDVSGLQFVDLASIAPTRAGDRLEVSARKTKIDVELGALAAQARTIARGALRQDEVPDAQKIALEVNIDSSISMLGRIDDGSVAAAVDLLAGISTVIANPPMQINLLGRVRRELPPCDPQDAAMGVQEALGRALLGVGFQSDRRYGGLDAERQWVFTITDSVPADYPSTVVADGGRAQHHLVVLAAAVAGKAPLGSESTLLLTPPANLSTTDALLASPIELTRVVRSMVAGLSSGSDSSEVSR